MLDELDVLGAFLAVFVPEGKSTLDDTFQNVYKTKHLEVIVFKRTSLISLLFAVNPDNQQ